MKSILLFAVFISLFFAKLSIAENKTNPMLFSVEKTNEIKSEEEILESLLYTKEEMIRILDALSRYLNKDKTQEKNEIIGGGSEIYNFTGKNIKNLANFDSSVYLDSILFFSKKNWSIWANGRKISNDDSSSDSVIVRNINEEFVDLSWMIHKGKWKIISTGQEEKYRNSFKENGDKIEIMFRLKPNQTYLLIDNKVIEGKENM